MTYLLNSFAMVLLAILAGSVFISAVVIWVWSMIEELIKGY